MDYFKFNVILLFLVFYSSILLGQSNLTNPSTLANELKWGQFESHPAKSLLSNVSWLSDQDAKLISLGLIEHQFDVESYSKKFPEIFKEYNSLENEFEKHRALEKIKNVFIEMQSRAMSKEFFLSKLDTKLGEYSFDEEAFPDVNDFYPRSSSHTSIENSRDRNVFPRMISMTPKKAEIFIQEVDDRNVDYYVIVKPFEGTSSFLRLNTVYLRTTVVMTIMVIPSTLEVIAVNPYPLTEFHLYPNEIAGHISYEYNEDSIKEIYIYPRKHEMFNIENNDTGEDFEISPEWYRFWWTKTGDFYIRGGDVEQKIFLIVDPESVTK